MSAAAQAERLANEEQRERMRRVFATVRNYATLMSWDNEQALYVHERALAEKDGAPVK